MARKARIPTLKLRPGNRRATGPASRAAVSASIRGGGGGRFARGTGGAAGAGGRKG